MEKIISNTDIVLYTGIVASDAKLEVFNKSMTAILASALGVKQFDRWDILAEEVRLSNPEYIRLNSFPVVEDTISVYADFFQKNEITDFTFQADEHDFRKWHVLQSDGSQGNLGRKCVYVAYTSGFLLQGTITLNDNDVAAITLSVTTGGVTTTYTFITSGTPGATEILIGADFDETMTNIATKIGGTGGAGFVTMPLGMTATASEVSATPKIVIENADEMLDELKLAVAYMVAGAITDKSQIEGVSAYKMGTKSVNFRDMAERNFTEEVIEKYASKYKRISILSS